VCRPAQNRRYFYEFLIIFLCIQKIFLPLHPILAVILIKAAEIDEVKEPDKVKRYRFDGDEKSEYFTALF